MTSGKEGPHCRRYIVFGYSVSAMSPPRMVLHLIFFSHEIDYWLEAVQVSYRRSCLMLLPVSSCTILPWHSTPYIPYKLVVRSKDMFSFKPNILTRIPPGGALYLTEHPIRRLPTSGCPVSSCAEVLSGQGGHS